MITYEVELFGGDMLEVSCASMNQQYGFLVFTNSDKEPVYGIRAEHVMCWRRVEAAPKPISIRSRVSATKTKTKRAQKEGR